MFGTPRAVAMVAAVGLCGVAASMTNMNGNYSYANQKVGGAPAVHRGDGFFDVYTEVISSHYGEVKWDTHTMALPAEIVSKFDGKLMNIVGYEFDIVRNVSGEEVSVPAWEQYNHHYNNNLLGKGTKLVKTGIPTYPGGSADEAGGNHHMGKYPGYEFVQTGLDAELGERASAYSNQFLPMGNGAESRRTFHYFPPGYGAQVYSPTEMTLMPMIIDQRNREGKIQDPSGRHGIVPKESNVGPEAMYSGIMECPCTDKWAKHMSEFSTLETGVCGATSVATAAACFSAAAELGLTPVTANLSVSSASHPPSCSVTPVSGGFEIVFNSLSSSAVKCGDTNTSTPRVTALTESLTNITIDLNPNPMPASPSILGAFMSTGAAPNSEQYDVRISELSPGVYTAECLCVSTNCKAWPTANGTITNSVLSMFADIPGEVSYDNNVITFSNGVQWTRVQAYTSIVGEFDLVQTATYDFSYRAVITAVSATKYTVNCTCITTSECNCFPPTTGTLKNGTLSLFSKIPGTVSGDNRVVTFSNGAQWVRPSAVGEGTATLTLSGPSDVWFGVGLGSGSGRGSGGEATGYTMELTPYAIVVLGNGTIVERQLGNHNPGTVLPTSLTIVSSTVADGTRTVVLTRPFGGPTASHFRFDPLATVLPFINAVGSSPDFGYHQSKATGDLHFVGLDGPTCVCDDSTAQGTLGGFAWGAQRCNAAPLGQMLDDPEFRAITGGVNPTCSLKYYKGGLRCCKGNTILLDSDQEGTYPDIVDTYRVKFRWYYETGGPQVNDYYWTSWWTEHDNNEHDVPPCAAGSDECVYRITSNFTVGQMPGFDAAAAGGRTTFINMEGHCHVGCISMELWIMNDPSNPELLCKTKSVYGTGDEAQNEDGYILGNLPCIFGNLADGFAAPVVLNSTTKLMSVKLQNNTVPRYGDMALWEISGAYPRST